MKAVSDYKGQYDDELSFSLGDEIKIISEGTTCMACSVS